MRDASGVRLYDGLTGAELARRIGAPAVHLFDEIGSTQDAAHDLAAAGAPEGTVVLAEVQLAGRGRLGRQWQSERGRGIWLTLLARPADADMLDLLSLRVGLYVAVALDALALDEQPPIQVKWPNDLYQSARKVGGILVEARWRDARPEWVAVGVGLNSEPAAGVGGSGGLAFPSRPRVLASIVPAIRRACEMSGMLAPAEMRAFAERDYARGRRCREPALGVVAGIDAAGSLLIDAGQEQVSVRSGSLVFAEDR